MRGVVLTRRVSQTFASDVGLEFSMSQANYSGFRQADVRNIPAGRAPVALFIGIRSLGQRIRAGNDRGALALRWHLADLALAERIR